MKGKSKKSHRTSSTRFKKDEWILPSRKMGSKSRILNEKKAKVAKIKANSRERTPYEEKLTKLVKKHVGKSERKIPIQKKKISKSKGKIKRMKSPKRSPRRKKVRKSSRKPRKRRSNPRIEYTNSTEDFYYNGGGLGEDSIMSNTNLLDDNSVIFSKKSQKRITPFVDYDSVNSESRSKYMFRFSIGKGLFGAEDTKKTKNGKKNSRKRKTGNSLGQASLDEKMEMKQQEFLNNTFEEYYFDDYVPNNGQNSKLGQQLWGFSSKKKSNSSIKIDINEIFKDEAFIKDLNLKQLKERRLSKEQDHKDFRYLDSDNEDYNNSINYENHSTFKHQGMNSTLDLGSRVEMVDPTERTMRGKPKRDALLINCGRGSRDDTIGQGYLGFNNHFHSIFKNQNKETKNVEKFKGLIQRKYDQMKKKNADSIKAILNSSKFNLLLSFLILVSMVGDDIRMVTLTKKHDIMIDVLIMLMFLIFLIEFFVNCLKKKMEYVRSMLFVFDILATLSILLDLSLIRENFLANLEK